MTDLNHTHLATFYGLSLDKKGTLLAMWELCNKGSLTDVVFNEEIQLDSIFRCSIARDIIFVPPSILPSFFGPRLSIPSLQGLEFLHNSPLGLHGALCAENCVIDSRWTVKLTDFGLPTVLRSFAEKKHLTFRSPNASSDPHPPSPISVGGWKRARVWQRCSTRPPRYGPPGTATWTWRTVRSVRRRTSSPTP